MCGLQIACSEFISSLISTVDARQVFQSSDKGRRTVCVLLTGERPLLYWEVEKPSLGIPMKLPLLGSPFSIVLSFLLVCFAVPYICDVASCEELYGTPHSQAALVDGETIDPGEEDTVFASLDWGMTGDLRPAPITRSLAIPPSFRTCSVRCPSLPTSGPRPPPVTP